MQIIIIQGAAWVVSLLLVVEQDELNQTKINTMFPTEADIICVMNTKLLWTSAILEELRYKVEVKQYLPIQQSAVFWKIMERICH